MLFPALVILPGMIAAGLAYTDKDHYRLPPRLVMNEAYATAIPAVQQAGAQNLDADASLKLVGEAVGFKMNPAKVAAIIKDNTAKALPEAELKTRIQDAVSENDYDGVILSLVKKYCPPGMLGLALTALLASFMSGMAGNVTAFNTVWTYDLYQAYLAPNKSDAHYMNMGRVITVIGIALSIACAYFASNYSNAMDIIQLVFGFVNAPLFATFVLGMFWKRTTAHGAFYGLLGGTAGSMVFHATTLAAGNVPGIKGGYLGVLAVFPSEMAQNFWLATFAFSVCLLLTLVITLATKRTKNDEELKGLVYSLTPRIVDEDQAWYGRPAFLGCVLLTGCVLMNFLFW